MSSRQPVTMGATSRSTAPSSGRRGGEQLGGRGPHRVGVGEAEPHQAALGLVGDAVAVQLDHHRVAERSAAATASSGEPTRRDSARGTPCRATSWAESASESVWVSATGLEILPASLRARSGHTLGPFEHPFDRPSRFTGVAPYHAAMAQYAAALSQHPVAAHAVGRGRRRDPRAFDGDEPDLVVCFVSPHFVGAFDDIAYALRKLLEPEVLHRLTAVAVIGGARGRGRARRSRCSRRGSRTRGSRRVALDASRRRPTARRSSAGPTSSTDDPRTLLLLADPFSVPGRRLPAPARREVRPALAVIGGAGVGGARPGRQPARARRPRRRRRRGRRVARRRRGAHGRVAGLPADRQARTSSPRASATSSTSSRASPRSSGSQELARPRRRTKTATLHPRRACTSASSSTSTRPTSGAATSSCATCSAPTGRRARIAIGDEVERRADRAVPGARRGRGRRGPPRAARRRRRRGRAAVHVQRPRARSSSACPTTTPASSTSCSGRCRSPARSAPARSGPSAAATSCTASPPASPSSTEQLPHRRAPLRDSGRGEPAPSGTERRADRARARVGHRAARATVATARSDDAVEEQR